jgi:hypothetical protein
VISRIIFTVTFPRRNGGAVHVPLRRLHSLVRRQLSDLEVIDTIDHLFKCHRCLENYRFVRSGYLDSRVT